MRISEGKLSLSGGGTASISAVLEDAGPAGNNEKFGEKSFWSYSVAERAFRPVKVNRIVTMQPTTIMYEVTTKGGAKISVPAGTKILRQNHGIETTQGVKAMCEFKSWVQGSAVLVDLPKDGAEPKKILDPIVSVTKVGGDADPAKRKGNEKPVFEITGAAGVGRLLVVDKFLVG